MATTTRRAPPSRQQSGPAQTGAKPAQNVALLEPPRLPFLPAVHEQFPTIDEVGWHTLVESIFPAAKTVQAVRLALDYCARRKLDIFKKPVHIVPIWSASLQKEVETVWPGIAELRTTASRTGSYAGMDAPEFGDMTTEVFKGRVKKGQDAWEDVEETVVFPEWCRITVYRMVQGHRVGFVGPTCYWNEYYAKRNRWVDIPNDRWVHAPSYQLEKCAEAGALRRAFPEEIGNELAAEEVGNFHDDPAASAADVTDQGSATTTEIPPEPKLEEEGNTRPASKVQAEPKTEAARTDWMAKGTSVAEVQQGIFDLIEKTQSPDDVAQVLAQNENHGKAMKGGLTGAMWKEIEASCERILKWMESEAAKGRT